MQKEAIKANEIVIFSISEVSNRDGSTAGLLFCLESETILYSF